MEKFNLPQSPFQTESNPVEEAMTNALNTKIFEEGNLKYFALVQKVDVPVGMISFLDFIETEDVVGEQNSGTFLTPLLDVSTEPMKVMGLKLFNKTVQQKTYQVSASLTREMIISLKEMGIDAIEQTERILINEAKQGIFKEILQIIDGFAETSYRKTWTKGELRKEKYTKWIHKYLSFLEKWIPSVFKGIYKKQVIIKNDVPTQTAIRIIVSKILGACNKIAINSRRGPGNVIITNCQLGTILQDSPGFVQTPMYGEVSLQTPCEPYMIGTIHGITIFVNPMMTWNDNTITVLRAPKEGEPCLNIPYMGVNSLMTIAEATMAPKIALRLRYNPLFVGQDNSSDKYYEKIYFKLEKNLI